MPLYNPPPNYALIPYNIDGSNAYNNATTATPTLLTATELEQLTRSVGEVGVIACGQNVTRYLGIQFAAPVDIDMWHASYVFGSTAGSVGALEWSNTTTNFQDGTWTAFTGGAVVNPTSASFINSNNDVSAANVNNITHVRIRVTGGSNVSSSLQLRNLLIYGNYSSGFGLELWHPTLDQRLRQPDLYFGDVGRNTSSDLTFRVKNSHPTLTANSIVVAGFAGSNEPSPTNVSQFTLSNGGAFASSVNIGNLAAGAISSVITVRRSTLVNAATGLWTVRLRATAGSWT